MLFIIIIVVTGLAPVIPAASGGTGDREGLPYNCKGRVGGIGNVCPLRHGINAVPPFSGENSNPFGLRPFPLTGEFPASGGGFKISNRSEAPLNYPFSIINYQLKKADFRLIPKRMFSV